MKKILVLTFCLIFLVAAGATAQPQLPQIAPVFDIELNYLSLDITHEMTGDSLDNYIEEITVIHNGKEVIKQNPGRQLEETETYLYYMPAVTEGDEIKVEVYSSTAGSASVTFRVRGDYLEDGVVND